MISAAETMRLTLPGFEKAGEIKQKADGTWSIFYPDPGFNPCDCSKSCRTASRLGPTMHEMHAAYATLEDAQREASECQMGECKIILVETQSERMSRRWADRRAELEQG